MKILLVAINAKYIHSNLAVYSLKAYAKSHLCVEEIENTKSDNTGENLKIQICEYTINNYAEDILQDIYEQNPDVIAFSCYIWNIAMVKELMEELAKIMPETDIFVGGPEVSYVARDFLDENRACKGVMVGEGEKIFTNLCRKYLDHDKKLEDIPGMVFRSGTDEIITNRAETMLDLNDIPFAYNDLEEFENKIIYYESSRGCPFSCSYCLSSIEKKVRLKDTEIVKKELQFFMDNHVAQVKFVDRTFNCVKKHAIEIWNYILEHDNGITNFHFEIAADILNDEEIAILAKMRPGLVQLEIGVQSTNEKTLSAINRKTNLTILKNNVAKIKEGANVHQHLDLIAGLPYEGYDSFAQSFNDVYMMQPDQLQLGFLKLLWGSAMKEQSDGYGIVCKSKPPYEVLYTYWLSYDEVLKLKALEEAVEIYYNSGQFSNTIHHLERFFDTPFKMYEQIGEYYKLHGKTGVKHNRIDRYNILREFIAQTIDNAEVFDELLTYDLYLRENIKTRPDFAGDLKPYAKGISEIYVREEKERNLLPDYKDYNYRQLLKMTHIEIFTRDIVKLVKEGIDEPCIQMMLFDYKNRNPINNDARTKVI